MELVQIVPRLPPAIDGLGDYTFLLAKELRGKHGINTRFVVGDPLWGNAETLKPETLKPGISKSEIGNWKSGMTLDGFRVYQLRERSAAELLRVLNKPGMPQTVLLQYVGYGYEKRGCPVWLAKGLSAWRKGEDAKRSAPRPMRLMTMFHELYAFGPPWSSSFWTSPLQRWIAKFLAQLSDHCFTNMKQYARALQSMTSRNESDFTVMPVFSNIGEPESLPSQSTRKPQMLIYGGLSRKGSDRTFTAEAVCKACQAFQIKTAIAFGKKPFDATFGCPVENRGVLDPSELVTLLLQSRIGYLDYFDGYLAKSGIFASYCAHGVVPLLLRDNNSRADGLEMNKHFLVAEKLAGTVSLAEQIRVGERALDWYQPHSRPATARTIAQKLLGNNVELPVQA